MKGKVYKMAVIPAMMHSFRDGGTKKNTGCRARMLGFSLGETKMDRIRNVHGPLPVQ